MTNNNTRLRVLHFCYSGHPQPGIIQQLAAENKATRDEQLDWEIAYFTHGKHQHDQFIYSTGLNNENTNIFSKIYNYFYLRLSALRWLIRKRKQWDLLLLRYMVGDPFLFIFSLVSRNFLTVHHTKEEEEVSSNHGLSGFIGLTIERISGRNILRRSAGCIAVTKELLEYEQTRRGKTKPGFLFPNCIDADSTVVLDDQRGGKVKLIFVGARSYIWNGLEYIYAALDSSTRDDFELHIVGNIPAQSSDPRVIYHGPLNRSDLESLYASMDIGLGTFGLHHKNMKEACSLKSRDYLANGLAVVADHIDSGLPGNFPYYTRQIFVLDNIVNLALDNRDNSKLAIRIAALEHLDKKQWTKKLITDLTATFTSDSY